MANSIQVGNIIIEVGINPDIAKLVEDARVAFINASFSFGRAFQPKHLDDNKVPSERALIFAAGDAEELAACIRKLLDAVKPTDQA